MLVIRREQMETLRQQAIDEFKQRLQRLLGHPGPAQPDAGAVAARIDREIAFARGFGFTRQREIARYVEIVCSAFPGSGRALPKAALAILQDARASEAERLERLSVCLGVTSMGA
jgi:hypothetical protein